MLWPPSGGSHVNVADDGYADFLSDNHVRRYETGMWRMNKEEIEIGEFNVSLSTDLLWLVEHHGYLIATFRYEFQEEAVAFAQSLSEADVEEKLKHNWE